MNVNPDNTISPNVENFYIETRTSGGRTQKIIKYREESTTGKTDSCFKGLLGCFGSAKVQPHTDEKEVRNLIVRILSGEQIQDVSIDDKARFLARKIFGDLKPPPKQNAFTTASQQPLQTATTSTAATVVTSQQTLQTAMPTSSAAQPKAVEQSAPPSQPLPTAAPATSFTTSPSTIIDSRQPEQDVKRDIPALASKTLAKGDQTHKLSAEKQAEISTKYKMRRLNLLPENFYKSIDAEQAVKVLEGRPGAWLLRFSSTAKQTVVCYNDSQGITRQEFVKNMSWEEVQKKYGKNNFVTPTKEQMDIANASRVKTNQKSRRALQLFKKLYSGLSKGAIAMSTTYRAEAIDPRHRYGSHFRALFKAWQQNKHIKDSFNEWVSKLEQGLNVPGMTTDLVKLARETTPVTYLDANQRKEYLMKVEADADSSNRITTQHLPPNYTTDVEHEHPQIFVIDPNDQVYVGTYNRGTFHHSSLVSAGATKGAGEFYLTKGVLTLITSKSGHYWPSEDAILSTLEILEKNGIDLSKVKFTLVTEGEPDHTFSSAKEYMEAVSKARKNPQERPTTAAVTVYNRTHRDMEEILTDTLSGYNYSFLRPGQSILEKDALIFCYVDAASQKYVEVTIKKDNSTGKFLVQPTFPQVGEVTVSPRSLNEIIVYLQEMSKTTSPPNILPTSSQYTIQNISTSQAKEILQKEKEHNFLLRTNQSFPDYVVLCRYDATTNEMTEMYLTEELGSIISIPPGKDKERQLENFPDLDSYLDSLKTTKTAENRIW